MRSDSKDEGLMRPSGAPILLLSVHDRDSFRRAEYLCCPDLIRLRIPRRLSVASTGAWPVATLVDEFVLKGDACRAHDRERGDVMFWFAFFGGLAMLFGRQYM